MKYIILLFCSAFSWAQTGILVDFANNSSNGWIGTNPAKFNLTASNGELNIVASPTGFENLEFSFSSIDITANPILKLKIKSPAAFTMRIDLTDNNGRSTNATPTTQNITINNNYVTYTFNYTGKFNQTFPSTATVDPSKIVRASIFFNAGTGFNNTVTIDDFNIGDPILFTSGKILINQVGYEQIGPKEAMYQIDNNSLPSDSFFVVNDVTNAVVFKGKLSPLEVVTGWTGRYFAKLNFSTFQTIGSYKIKINNLTSYSFSINKNLLFNTAAPKIVSFFNLMRNTDNADLTLSFNGPRNDQVNVYGGWSDATGDPGKHMSHLSYANFFNPQQIPFVAWSLMKAYQINPTAYTSFSTNLWSEVAWGADYLVRNVDPAGYLYIAIFDDWGGAPATREITEWGQAPACDYCRSSNFQAAMREGAGIAIAALARAKTSNVTTGNFTPAQYLAKAEVLYSHLKSPGTGYATKNLEYCNDHQENIIDFYCGLLAATELYKATTNATYLADAQVYATKLLSLQNAAGWLSSNVANTRPYYHAADEGLPVLALLEYNTIDASKNTEINSFITNWVSWYQSISKEVTNSFNYVRQYGKPYSASTLQAARKAFFVPQANETGYWWQGENARIASMSAAFLAANRSLGLNSLDTSYSAKLITSQLDWVLGKNPFDVCMMTGVGTTTYPTYLNGSKGPNRIGGICNGISAKNLNETNIDWAPYDQAATDNWQNWRWVEQWLPHDAWFLLALAYLNDAIDNPPTPLAIQLDNKASSPILPNSVQVVPNPFNEQIELNFPQESDEMWFIKILDIKGQIIYEGNWNNIHSNEIKTIKLPFLQKGIYILNLYNSSSQRTIKIVKN